MNWTIQRAQERLTYATLRLERRIEYLLKRDADGVCSTSAYQELAVLQWVVTVLKSNMNHTLRKIAREHAMPNEIDDGNGYPERT